MSEVTEGHEGLDEIAKMRSELERLRAFETRVKQWMYPDSYFRLFMREFNQAKSPTSTSESCTRAGLTAVLYRCIELCASSVPKAEGDKIRKMLPS